jgi:glycosyltransferase involved in cell wall biosynthesis
VRILYSTPFVPYPPTYGGTITPYHHLKGLAARGHHLVMVLPLRRSDDSENVGFLRAFGEVRAVPVSAKSPPQDAVQALVNGASFRVTRHRIPAVESATREILEDGPFDVVYLDSFFTSYLLPIVRTSSPSTPVVLLEHNVESQVFARLIEHRGGLAMRILALWERPRMSAAERAAHSSLDRVITFSEEDARTISAGAPGARTFVLGPGTPTYVGETIPPPPDRRTVLFFGAYHWPPNVDGAEWMTRRIWPRVRDRMPDARLVLAGLDPSRRVAPLANESRGIETTGFVEDAVATTRAATVCAVPLRVGGGIRLKIIEALANDRPVVTTTLGAEGLGLSPNLHALFADDEEAFAASVVRLLQDEPRSRRIAREGRSFVEERYSWPRVLDRLESLLAAVVAERTASS